MFDPSAGSFRFRTDTGEDLPRLARLAYDTAAICCEGCRNYHTMWPYLRSRGLAGAGPEHNLPLHVELLARAAGGRDSVRWLVAGSADAGLFSVVARTAAAMPGVRHGFTVADRCETPLALCRAHAEAIGADVETVRTDLLAFDRDASFDVVFMHQLMKFFLAEDRPAFLSKARNWLAPGGSICITVQDEPADRPASRSEMKAWRAEMVRADAASGAIDLPEAPEAFLTRLITMNRFRPEAEHASLADYVALVEDAGFAIADVAPVPNEDPRASTLREGAARYMIIATRV